MSIEQNNLTRTYLETLSSSDLIEISQDYGIDIPDNLSRGFIISEILDTLEEQILDFEDLKDSSTKPEVLELPFSYNENKIIAVLKNPVWCYVSWDFASDTTYRITNDETFDKLLIQFDYFSSNTEDLVQESLDIIINSYDKEQFVLLTQDFPSFQVSLIATFKDKCNEVIATSSRVLKPKFPFEINLETLQKEFSCIQRESGLQDILKTHYSQHRQSFVGT